MFSLVTLQTLLWGLNILARAGVVGKLLYTGLHRTYRWFFWWWVFSVIRSLALYPFSSRSSAYVQIWTATEPLVWFFHVMVVLELYRLALAPYRGIYTVGKWFFCGALVVALCLAGSATANIWGRPTALHQVMILLDGGVRWALSILMLSLLGFIALYSMPLKRNLLLHCCLYTTYFLSQSAATFYRNITGFTVTPEVNLMSLIVWLGCQVGWLVLLSPKGEYQAVTVGHSVSNQERDRLLAQLSSINDSLLRTAKK